MAHTWQSEMKKRGKKMATTGQVDVTEDSKPKQDFTRQALNGTLPEGGMYTIGATVPTQVFIDFVLAASKEFGLNDEKDNLEKGALGKIVRPLLFAYVGADYEEWSAEYEANLAVSHKERGQALAASREAVTKKANERDAILAALDPEQRDKIMAMLAAGAQS